MHTENFIDSLKIQSRIIGALLLREILTRYGRHNIGFFWLFVEPMIFNLGVLLIRLTAHERTFGLDIVAFVSTGYATILLWRNTINRCGNALEPNRSLLHHRNVRVFDIFVSRILLEIAGTTLSFLIISSILIAAGVMHLPDNIFKVFLGWFLLAWFSGGVALIIGAAAYLSETFERLWHIITYLFLPICGAFTMTAFAPPPLAVILEHVPIVSCVELLREGYFGLYADARYDIPFVLVSNLIVSFVGIYLSRMVSYRVEGA